VISHTKYNKRRLNEYTAYGWWSQASGAARGGPRGRRPSRGAKLPLNLADMHLNARNISYDRMYLRARSVETGKLMTDVPAAEATGIAQRTGAAIGRSAQSPA
jgi:hypothetical protein